MKIAIFYKSITGNTKVIAEAIRSTFNDEEIVYFGEPKNDVEADIYIVGSWTDKGQCSKEIKELLSGINNKKIVYFGTAGFGGSTIYYETLYKRVKENINSSNQILGYFYCQGKMPINVRERYTKMLKQYPEDEKIKESIKNFDYALSHPNKDDIENVKVWIKSIIEKYS